MASRHSKTLGVFRHYTEHSGERDFEIHPVLSLATFNGTTFTNSADYHNNITTVNDGSTHALSTYKQLVDAGSITYSVKNLNNTNYAFNFPNNANYVTYTGTVVNTLASDGVSSNFTFTPTACPAGNISGAQTIRCRTIDNTAAATTAAGLSASQTVAVNGLVRIDMAAVSNSVAGVGLGNTGTFNFPIEIIVLAINGSSAAPGPVISAVATPTVTQMKATVTWTTDVASDSQVLYGTSKSAVTNSVYDATSVTSHSVNVYGLSSGTTYFFDVVSTAAGSSTTDDNTDQHYTFGTSSPCVCQ